MPQLEDAAAAVTRRVGLRLLPFLCLLYMVAYLDRANVAFASVSMRSDLNLSEEVFGFGSGLFFIGYFILEIPGALIVQKWGARRWMARILITWGIATAAIGLVHTARQFYIARFLLGASEAGFFPGVLVYLSQWIPERDRARATSVFIVASPISLAVGAPLSALILRLHTFNIPGWRWLFIVEGLPAVVLGIVTVFYLTDFPNHAHWLSEPERLWLIDKLAEERQRKTSIPDALWWKAFLLPDVVFLTLANLLACAAGYAFIIWIPTVLENSGAASHGSGAAGALRSFIPFCGSVIGALIMGWLSDKLGKPRLCACISLLGAGICLFLAVHQSTPGAALGWLALAGAGVFGWVGPFWVLPSLLLSDAAAAASIGLINSLGNLGGFAGPFLVGLLLSSRWSMQNAMLIICAAYFLAAGFTCLVSSPQPSSRSRSCASRKPKSFSVRWHFMQQLWVGNQNRNGW